MYRQLLQKFTTLKKIVKDKESWAVVLLCFEKPSNNQKLIRLELY